MDKYICKTHPCPSGMYCEGSSASLIGTICKNCLRSNCDICDPKFPQSCLRCKEGFYFDLLQCVPCSDNCKYCYHEPACSVCKSGYYLSNRQCLKGDINCADQYDQKNCKRCEPNYFLGKSFTCETCIKGCKTCSTADDCSLCQEGFFMNVNTCEACSANCLNCSSSSVCQTCQSGFQLKENACMTCPENCLTCSDSNTCTKCAFNIAAKQGKCTICDEQCIFCLGADRCVFCKEGYYKVDNKCAKIECNKYSKCPEGQFCSTYQSVDKCYKQVENCRLYNTEGTCISCETKFALIKQVKCEPCEEFCEHCHSGTQCSQCLPGYYLEKETCKKCTAGCTNCLNSGECTECEADLHLIDDTCQELTLMSTGSIIGIVVAVIILTICVVAGLTIFIIKRKKKSVVVAKSDLVNSNTRSQINRSMSWNNSKIQ
ncbi:Cysteine-rich membrane protein 1 [Spironucleus salmonicida]|uniref:Cysteine-rich membrane protein 1 n=1 Tax=Spironucleus salmonicida TaxID=348837 RepID=V6LI44_9EUKA|nr:Cysteine-rich membrane protein 1 [Spironucleus salmonicida]|eukprot:EST44240.1 Cysteine-rich membrane protein 1 [Spironucleus salmonicida]